MEDSNKLIVDQFDNYDIPARMWAKNEIKKRVEAALAKEEEILLLRRERLKEKIRTEELELKIRKEIPRKSDHQVIQEMERKLLDIETKREQERRDEVDRKLIMLKMMNSEELRTAMVKKRTEVVKRDQWWQMQHKLTEMEKKSKVDELYHEMIIRKMKEDIRLKEEEIRKNLEKKIATREALGEQMEWKNQRKTQEFREKEKEKLELESLIKKIEEEKLQEDRERKKKTEEAAATMKEFMENERKQREARKEEEKAILEEFELFKDSHQPRNKVQFKEEIDAFLDCVKELKLKRQIEEQRFDERLAELTKQKDIRNDKQVFEEARQNLLQTVLKGREEQLRQHHEVEKELREKEAQERRIAENEVHSYKCEIEKLREREAEKKRAYAEELRRQMQARDEEKKKQFKEKMKERERYMMEEEERRREVEILINHPLNRNQQHLQSDG